MKKRTSSLYVPILLIVLGIGWLLGNLGVWDFGDVFSDWWPILFIIGGLLSLQNNPRQFTAPFIFIALGFFLILTNLEYLPGNFWSYFWPAVIIFIGLSLLSKRSSFSGLKGLEDNSDSVNMFVVFAGQERQMHSHAFSQAEITVIFGGATLDLREAAFSEHAEVHVTTVFGGTEILVPKNVSVVVKGVPIFGGFDDKTHPDPTATRTLKISGTAVFGGVDVKHEKG